MMLRKVCLPFVVVLLPGSALPETISEIPEILEVPEHEMPGAPMASHSCWKIVQNARMTFIRRDSDVEEVSSGSLESLESPDTGYVKFENCDGCPENTPSWQSFSATLIVPYSNVQS